jgi:hypothetical protein
VSSDESDQIAPTVWKPWWNAFLAALRLSGNVSDSARAAGVTRQTVYEDRRNYVHFARAWSDALEEALDQLERTAWERATVGNTITETRTETRPDGAVTVTVIEKQRVSDTLLMALLKAHRPGRYGDQIESRRNSRSPSMQAASLEVKVPVRTPERIAALAAAMRDVEYGRDG